MPKKLTCNPESLCPWAFSRKVSPSAPLLSVQEILSSRDRFRELYPRRLRSDTPLATIYRIYVAILAGRYLSLRNEIEYFWDQKQWRVYDIPEPPPTIQDKEQRAILATIPYLLARAFNSLIQEGLPRDAPAILDSELMKHLRARPKVLEKVPRWAELVEPLSRPLLIPDAAGRVPCPRDVRVNTEGGIDIDMYRKNILVSTLPVLFT